MRLKEIKDELHFKGHCGPSLLEREVKRGYSSDLMSDVLAHGQPGDLWVTCQVHLNIVAVASMKELSAVVLVNGRTPLPETAARAERENVVILLTELPAFEVAGRLYALGIPGI